MNKNELSAHLLSILALPFVVVVVIPFLIIWNTTQTCCEFFSFFNESVLYIFSGFFLIGGMILFVSTIRQFATVGKGTLAPWNPPKHFVATGIYLYVRNPMIIGVNLVLVGISFVMQNENILLWMVIFVTFNTLYFIVKEEPDLEKRFGDSYCEYKRNVPRWIPRLKPWRAAEISSN